MLLDGDGKGKLWEGAELLLLTHANSAHGGGGEKRRVSCMIGVTSHYVGFIWCVGGLQGPGRML